jgi:hypothetical protein
MASSGDPTHDVTLVTGDRVQVTAGVHPSAAVLHTPSGTTSYNIFETGDALCVMAPSAHRSPPPER